MGDQPKQHDDAQPVVNGGKLTWAALLGRWVEFAQSSLALPEDEGGRRLRASVPDIIMLQAAWFALGQVEVLDASQRSLGLDRAEVLIDKHASALQSRWADEPLPGQLQTLINDARERLTQCQANRS